MGIEAANRHEVVIVGAGPVGLALGLTLARSGREVLVLEKEPSTADHSRAPAIWPATQEVLADLDVVDEFLAEGLVLRRVEPWDVDRDRRLVCLPLEELADRTAFPHLLVLPQSRTEALLRDALERWPNATLRFSCEVTGVEPGPDAVRLRVRESTPRGRSGEENDEAQEEREGEATVEAAFVAGCDGAHSTVREALGAAFEGKTYPIRAALADVEPEGPHAERTGRGGASEAEDVAHLPLPRVTTQPTFGIGIPIGGGVWRLILPFAGSELRAVDDAVTGVGRSLLGTGHRTLWKSEFRLHRRTSSCWSRGRVVLAGDAAHLNSPVGGEGMNAGIQDTALLAPALLEALAADDPEPLARWARVRGREIDETVNRFTDLLTRGLLLARGGRLRPLMALARAALAVPPVRRRVLERVAMLR